MNLFEMMKDEKEIAIENLKNELRKKDEAYEKLLQQRNRQKEMLESKLSEEIKRNSYLGRRIRQLEKELEEEKNKSFFIKIKQSIINVIK